MADVTLGLDMVLSMQERVHDARAECPRTGPAELELRTKPAPEETRLLNSNRACSDPPTLDQELSGLSREQLTDLLRHCAAPALFTYYSAVKEIAKEGTLDFKGDPLADQSFPHFEFSEHRWLGDGLHLQGHDSAEPGNPAAGVNPLTLKNGISLTYGTLNGLAGDFFSAIDPICPGSDAKQRSDRFKAAFKTLWNGDPKKVRAILDVLKQETDGVTKILNDPNIKNEDKGKLIRELYEKLDPELLNPLNEASQQGVNPGASYKDLLKTNLDHFAPNARIVYDTGHAWALEVAAAGDLPQAYAINAFADHFLEDNFASGHLRVPRDHMWDMLAKNVCVNMMHNEDNTLGVNVRTPGAAPTQWRSYGDSMLFDEKVSKPTQKQCFAALKASVDEVYEACDKKTSKSANTFKAWDYAPTMTPTLETPQNHDKENHPPMFRVGADGKVLQRKGLLPYKIAQAKSAKWEYEPVVLDSSLIPASGKKALEYIYWNILAFRLTPYPTIGTAIKNEVEAWLEKSLPFGLGPILKKLWKDNI
ncbi:hypothetical protein PV04_03773 [Phialophora macrospora]|uniref:Uncharacterized protein n=1 Tax=Phialophora macrospora TaxID=1851006 RepID=A0A0D2D2D3_9EURO|nr:hypothetical protein PV04_03773 [Phialophora macrospora]